MNSIRTHVLVYVLGLAAFLFMFVPQGVAQTNGNNMGGKNSNFDPPPCDFNDTFYQRNGIDVTQLDSTPAQRFGFFRQFGPPARNPKQANWVVDNTCTQDPNRNNVRILATTGGYPDDGTGNATEFISIIAFLTNQNFFLPAPRGFATPTAPAPPIDDTSGNARSIQMIDIVSNFEGYPAPKQKLSNGVLAPTPCGSMGDPTLPAGTPCFPVTSIATSTLRQDWRFATNRNAIDGSDNNVVTGTGNGATIVNNSPFGYFCDDLLGMWILTYFWYTDASVGNPVANPSPVTAQCTSMLAQLASMHGTNLDGTPIVLTANELNFLEGKDVGATPLGPNFPTPPSPACMEEGQLAQDGSDGGAVWLICPAIPDPRAGAIAPDAFLDTVRKPNGAPLDPRFNQNFACLQIDGAFCNELTQAQQASPQITSAAGSN